MMNLDMVGRAHGRVMIGGAERLQHLAQELGTVGVAAASTTSAKDTGRERLTTPRSSASACRRCSSSPGFTRTTTVPATIGSASTLRGAAEIGRLALMVTARLAKNP